MPVAARSLANLRPGNGRTGQPGKIPASIKEMVEKALTKAGGVDYLTEQAHKNPAAFLGLVGKIIPLQLQTDPNTVVTLLSAHLLAATAVSDQLHSQPSAPPTINGNVEPAPQGNLLDAPIPEE